MSNDNPITILKKPVNVYYPKLTEIMNKCFIKEMFPDNLKNAQTTPCHTNDRENKKNYWRVSILEFFQGIWKINKSPA